MKKYVIPIIDILLGIYLVIAVISFNNPKETYPVCTQLSIDIADQSTFGFLNKKEIVNILKNRGLYPVDKRMDNINPDAIEKVLKKSPFINTAECSKSKDGIVFITITQRSPILRIKNVWNQDYYIDENGGVMPNSSYTSDLIIATGYADKKYAGRYLSILTNIINSNELWRDEVEQINILQDHGVEIIPRVGNHIIFLGYLPESNNLDTRKKDIEAFVTKQFDRLLLFYKYGLSKAGWNKYERIDLQYPNQVICKKCGSEVARLEAEKAAAEEADRKYRQEINPANNNVAETASPNIKKEESPKPEKKKPEVKEIETKTTNKKR